MHRGVIDTDLALAILPTAWSYVAFDVVPPALPPPDFCGVEPLSIWVVPDVSLTLEDAPIMRTDCSFPFGAMGCAAL